MTDLLGTTADTSLIDAAIIDIPMLVATTAANKEEVATKLTTAGVEALKATASPSGRQKPILIGLGVGLLIGWAL